MSTQATGPLTEVVLAFTRAQQQIVPRAGLSEFTTADWEPLTAFVNVDEFQRIGTRTEVMDWHQFLDMLTRWASRIATFETVVRSTSELPGRVYLEVEERHHHDGEVTVVNSLTVFDFDENHKIRQLRVYLQQDRSAS